MLVRDYYLGSLDDSLYFKNMKFGTPKVKMFL